MNKRRVILAVTVWLAASTAAQADTVRKIDGQVMGDVAKTSSLEVTVERGGATTKIPVNQIKTIIYSDEPARLNTARTAIEAGRYEDAVTGLGGINQDDVNSPLVKQDAQFYTALAKARIALAAADNKAVIEARELMFDFAKNNRGSYHYFEACEVLGDLHVAVREHEAARKFYDQLVQAPWPEYKMRAGVALGRAFLAEEEIDDALNCFQTVLDIEAAGESAARQRLAATLGRARCLAEAGQSDEAVKLVQDVVDKADAEEAELCAQAYNALGLAHRKAGRTQDALLAYLHVDVLYFTSPNEHIEALENLVELWEQVQRPERADEATQILQERYGRSPRSK